MTLKLKLYAGIALIVVFCLMTYACASYTKIEPGHVGVSIRKCSGGGVSEQPIPTGYYWKSVFCEDVIEYPTNLQTLILTNTEGEGHPEHDEAITVTSKEGLPISVDVSMSFTLDQAQVPAIYKKYRAEVNDIARKFMRQTVREGLQMTFAMYTAEELYADKKEIARAGVQKFLTDSLGKDGFVVQQFTINEQRPPKQVMEAIGAKVAMTQEAQKAEAEVRKTQALAAQAKAQALGEADAAEARAAGLAKARKLEADAEAYYNQTVSRSLTPELVRYETAKRWNGVMPTYTGGPVPLIDLSR